MNRKFEPWSYSELEYHEAADHLNRMAARGWKLCCVKNTGFYSNSNCWARYERTAVEENYDAVPVSEEEADYAEFCCDAGWNKIAQLKNGLCIFSSSKKGQKLYSDELSMLEHAITAGCRDKIIKNQVLRGLISVILPILAVTYLISKAGREEISFFYLLYILFLTAAVMTDFWQFTLNLCYHKYRLRKAEKGVLSETPHWLIAANRILAYWRPTLLFCFFLMGSIYVMRKNLVLGACFAIITAALEGVGLYFITFKEREYKTGILLTGIVFILLAVVTASVAANLLFPGN